VRSSELPAGLPSDNPIRLPEDDRLHRTEAARDFARQVLRLDVSEGTAAAVFGPWGSGKTSFVNLARTVFEREKIPVLEFNPWLFTGVEQLAERFFSELLAQLSQTDRLKAAGEAIGKYGEALSGPVGIMAGLAGGPAAGPPITAMFRFAAALFRRPTSIARHRKAAEEALRKGNTRIVDTRIVVILDDTDRLSGPEIREVFRLVRLTASLPNLIYILPCDRERIERALNETDLGLSGGDYLEKIIQLAWNLPEIPRHVLSELTAAAIEQALSDLANPGPFDEDAWRDIYPEIVRPLIRNMRDIRRYTMVLSGTALSLEGKVALHDLLALEAVRVFLPHVFRCLAAAADALTVTSPLQRMARDHERLMTGDEDSHGLDPRLKKTFDALIDEGRDHTAIVQAIVRRLFPGGLAYQEHGGDFGGEFAERQLQERRVAHEHVFRLYLERVVNNNLISFEYAERALALMADRDALDGFLRSLDPAWLPDVLEHLWGFEDRFCVEDVEPGVVVLLNLLPDIPAFLSDMWMGGPRSFVRRVTLGLLRRQGDVAECEDLVTRILPEVGPLCSRMELVLQVGYRTNTGRRLVSEDAAERFERVLRDEIGDASADALAAETDPIRLLAFASDGSDGPDHRLTDRNSPRLIFRMLRAAQAITSSGLLDSRAVRRENHLAWTRLSTLYGDEATLKAGVAYMDAEFASLKPWIESQGIPLNEAEALRQLANAYAQGHRPEPDC